MLDKDKYRGETMNFELYKRVIDRIVEDKKTLLSEDPKVRFSLIFHGGEPVIIGYDLLAKMLEYAKVKFEQDSISYSFGIQTNMTLLTEDIVSLFHKYDCQIGASFDGIKKGNEGRSKIIDEEKFINKIEMVKSLGTPIGFLLVANKSNIDTAMESRSYMLEKLNAKSTKMNYAEDVTVENSDNEVTGEEFFIKILAPILEDFIKNSNLYEDNLDQILNKFITENLSSDNGYQHSNCGEKICGGGINIIELNPDGALYFCGRYSTEFKDAYIMNIEEKDFLALKQLKRYTDFVKEKHQAILDTGCDLCYADGICDHGCMAFHYSKYGKYGIRKELVCPIFKNVYKWLSGHQVEIIEALERKYKFPYELKPHYVIKSINQGSIFYIALERAGIVSEITEKGFIRFSRKIKNDKNKFIAPEEEVKQE
jgi:radical SAM protein with 4Fe4S-binding SPASM domain